jgi:hypothetical protein
MVVLKLCTTSFAIYSPNTVVYSKAVLSFVRQRDKLVAPTIDI